MVIYNLFQSSPGDEWQNELCPLGSTGRTEFYV
jgi:hypothetical protein